MNKTKYILLIGLLLLSVVSMAEVIVLRSGQRVVGEIVLQNDEVVIVRGENGMRYQYPMNEVSSIGLEEKIVVEEGNPKYDSREGCNAIIETATNKLICGCKSTVIPASVKSRGYFPKGLFRRNCKGRFLKTDKEKAKRNYHYYTVKSYEEAKKLAYNIWSYHDTFCYIIDEVVEKKNVLKIKFFLPCIDCDDEGNFAEEGFYIYEIFKIKLRYNKGIKREPLLDLGE